MNAPVVIATNGYGIPVTIVDTSAPLATPLTLATNGFGTPVVVVASGGLPVTIEGYTP